MAEGKSPFQKHLITIDWFLDSAPPVFRCPVSGAVIHPGHDPRISDDPQDYVEPQYEEASTLLFAFPTVVGEFDFIQPELQQAIDEKRSALIKSDSGNENLSDFDILVEHLEKLGDIPVIYEIRLGAGPVQDTVYLGLDLYRPYQHLDE